MSSPAVALLDNFFAYFYARRQEFSGRFSFGTDKVNTIGSHTGAILLALFALLVAWKGRQRLISPINIAFNQAIAIARAVLVVNSASVLILWDKHEHAHEPNHNLKAAYLHLLVDALASLLAIAACSLANTLTQSGWIQLWARSAPSSSHAVRMDY